MVSTIAVTSGLAGSWARGVSAGATPSAGTPPAAGGEGASGCLAAGGALHQEPDQRICRQRRDLLQSALHTPDASACTVSTIKERVEGEGGAVCVCGGGQRAATAAHDAKGQGKACTLSGREMHHCAIEICH